MMKQTFRRKRNVIGFGCVALFILLLCIVLSIIFVLCQDYVFLIVLFFPTLLGVLFAIIAYIEYRGSIELDNEKVKFNYRLFSKSKELNKSGITLYYSDIRHIKKTYIQGDGIISKDHIIYTICLTNNTKVDVYLHHFGKDEETIISAISERLRTKK